ncbi:glycoside hydrolase [Aspergillus ibericus CBS 121593]|uniref:chitinase n=1 Tax=Aspergillus ibericus CBS 121593 TaxID=1448316 RepID=A0A395GSP7_9EURO|nr:glycoside hydrolase [Aspergillus ibericus CBS 121593]RAK98436.1 glycoside hydrolase [Aspergillus ibericus CBS 121593]
MILWLTTFVTFATAFTAAQAVSSTNTSLGSTYRPLFALHSNSTPIFQNVTGQSVNPLVKALQPIEGPSSHTTLQRREDLPTGTCAPGTPCVNGACCSNTGICGYSLNECGADVCISNCDAKAECGQYGVAGNNTCPINVCCSKFGFCGTTSDFCDAGCQEGYGGCGAVTEPSCGGSSARQRTVGYYEGWSSTRTCDKRLPSDLEVTALTHINFAFIYFHPTTFQIVPMSSGDEALYPQFTALKKTKPELKTWVSLGGWSFNDATNTPNTQTAFSDLAANAANRQTFITSVMSFLQVWGFDGLDIDWEYPGAPDRGGVAADTENYVTLLKELKSAFGTRYGLSVTLPASYWYLRWFDLQGIEANTDFLNVMTYDIHGVWDSSNKFTGPYVRPHTNLTEIADSLDLLWRNDINPSNVNLGVGWYGRSFTLKDPSCNTPGCVFSYGGTAGECTQSSGTLSNAEIQRIITANNLVPTFDQVAGVKWITWDTDQWVSYDDGESMQMKIDFANKHCLGGTLIWSMDQDSSDHTSSNDLLGIGTANGVSAADAAAYKEILAQADQAASKRNSCYWTFCGGECVSGYFTQTYATGQVLGVDRDSSCPSGEFKQLCCAPGTNTGVCSWHGFRGVGLSCATNYCPDGTDLIASNTNQYEYDTSMDNFNDWTCNGGSQSYCCSGFEPSPYTNTDALNLVGQDQQSGDDNKNNLSKRKDYKYFNIQPSSPLCEPKTGQAAVDALLGTEDLLWLPSLNDELSLAADSIYKCMAEEENAAADYSAGIVANIGQGAMGPGDVPVPPASFIEVPATLVNKDGGWQRTQYGKKDRDCSVTYYCRYGHGFDEVCDNQRWAIDKIMGGKTVYNVQKRPKSTYKDEWSRFRNRAYVSLLQSKVSRGSMTRVNCEVDEFPMGSLDDSEIQGLRYLNGIENGLQGQDWSDWIQTVFNPCKALRKVRGIKPPEPPVTWKFGPISDDDPRNTARIDGQHFIQKYGFDSQTPGSECWAGYTYMQNDVRVVRTVRDHGFRVHPNDPIFADPYNWPRQQYDTDPSYPDNLPYNIASASWLKRDVAKSVLQQELPLSAIYEAEAVADLVLEEAARLPPTPEPTDGAAFSSTAVLTQEGVSQRPSLPTEIARETSIPAAAASAAAAAPPAVTAPVEEAGEWTRRRKRHLAEHRQGQYH